MRLLILTSAALIIAAGAVAATPRGGAPAAQPPAAQPPPPPPSLPRIFAQAGYAEPAIPPSACRVVNANQAACTLPAMTAGRYFVRVMGASTATADGAAQQIAITAGDQQCVSTRAPDPKAPWAVGAKRNFTAGCVFVIVADAPMTVTAVYLDKNATADPAGPAVAIIPQAWTGALSALPVQIKQ